MSSTQEVGEIFGAGRGPAHAMMRSPTVLIASVGLWGMNVFFFKLFGINYVKVLKYDLLMLEDSGETPSPVRKSRIDMDATVQHKDDSGYNSDDEDYDDDSAGEAPTEPSSAISWSRLVGLSVSLLFMLHFTYYYWIDVLKMGSIGAVFAFYGVVTAAIAFPLPSTRWLRKATVIILQRCFELVNPRCSCVSPDPSGPRPIPFVDVFFADVMCSLSKVFFDWGMLFHMASHFPKPVPREAHNILIPSACAAVPFLIRARQCLIMYNVCRIKNDPNRFTHLWNALKYSTSIFPLCLSAYQKTVSPKVAHDLEIYLIILLVINALYALYWDIVNDWGMMKNPSAASAVCVGGVYPMDHPRPPTCGHAVLRPRLRFGVGMSALILVTDAVLRFSWTLRFYHKLFPSGDSFVLCTQFLEVFRRAIWNLLRVEWENLKQMKSHPPIMQTKSGDEEMTTFLTPAGKVAVA